MRRVDEAGAFDAALESCKREAKSAFGDDRVLLKTLSPIPGTSKYKSSATAAQHGASVRRNCSMQRRHQKVIEEAPAPGMDAATRVTLTEAAVKAAKAGNDTLGAGRIEFIADVSEGLPTASGSWR